MKHQLKNTIVLSTSLLLANVLIPTTLAFAEEAPGVNENSSYEILTDDTFVGQSDEDDFAVYFEDERVVYNYVFEENAFTLETETGTEVHTLTYNKGDDFLVLDGEPIHLEKTEYNTDNALNEMNSSFTSMATSSYSWNPIFYTSGSVSVSDMVYSVGALATVIGGVIGVGALLHLSIAQTTIAAQVSNWASAVSLGSLAAGYFFSGWVTYSQYRTETPVPDGGSSGNKQYAYRFQNVRVVGAIKGKSMNILLQNIGSWFFVARPY